MTQLKPLDLLTVHAERRFERRADGADVAIVVQGTSAFTGRQIFTRANEVRELVASLREVGFDDDDFRIDGVRAQIGSFLKTKSSSARYQLSIHCDDLDLLPQVLAAVARSKTAELQEVTWLFSRAAEQDAEELARCAGQASQKAKSTAETLGVRLLAVHRVQEVVHHPTPPRDAVSYGECVPAQRSVAAPSFGFALNHCEQAQVELTIEYRIGGLEPAAG